MNCCLTGLIAGILFFCCQSFTVKVSKKELRPFYLEGKAQGTTYHITYYARRELVSRFRVDSIFKKIDQSLSIYEPGSLINRFNGSVDGVLMDEHLQIVVRRSLQVFNATKGVFDITVFPLMEAWGFGPAAKSAPPDSATIRSILNCVGSGKLYIEGKYLKKKDPCVKIDVNGIAQGYTVDVIAGFLETMNISHYLVEVGGELRVKGKRYPGGLTMKVGIEAPSRGIADEPVISHIVKMERGAITTSGNYRKYHSSNGKKITHLMSPVTGYPFTSGLLSVTVWANDAFTADGYDNALMGMGLNGAFDFLKKHPELEAFFIYTDRNGVSRDTATRGFYKLISR